MPAKKATQPDKKETKETKKEVSKTSRTWVLVFIIIILIAIAGALAYGLNRQSPGSTSFSTFKNNFNSAQRVALYVQYTGNGTYPYSVQCAASLIQLLGSNHLRNKSTIDFFVIANSTSCLNWNDSVVPYAQCINVSNSEPSVFINYSTVNSTVTTPKKLEISGDQLFLSECGVATSITSTSS